MRSFSLKLQFAFMAALLTVLALVLVGAVLLPVVRLRQMQELDAQLAEDADELHELLAKHEAAVLTGADGMVARLLPPNLRLRYLEVETPEGRTLHRSGNLRGMDLKGADGVSQTLKVGEQEARIRTAKRGHLVLHVGTRLGTLAKTQKDLAMSLLIVLPVVALGAFGGGLLLGRKAVRPVTALTEAAEKISTDHPQERLPVPPARDEVARLTEVLNRTFDRLQRAYAVSSRFSADASHQLKTPVAVMRAGLDTLHGMSVQPTEARAEVDTLLRQSRRLTAIIDDLLLLAQVDAGRLQLETSTLDLVPILARVAEDAEVLTMHRGIVVESEWPGSLACTADPRRVGIILQNLIENAAKYTNDSGHMKITAASAQGQITIRVANTGAAIAVSDREAIFERFHRSESGENVAGHGLGLNIARELARAHGGELTLEKSDGEWTVFALRLPG